MTEQLKKPALKFAYLEVNLANKKQWAAHVITLEEKKKCEYICAIPKQREYANRRALISFPPMVGGVFAHEVIELLLLSAQIKR